jgi:hypothetical protein
VNSAFVSTFISIWIDYVNAKEYLAFLDRRFQRTFHKWLHEWCFKDDPKDFKDTDPRDLYQDALNEYDRKGAVYEGAVIPGFGDTWIERPYPIFFLGVIAPIVCTHVIPMFFFYIWVFLSLITIVPTIVVVAMLSITSLNTLFFDNLVKFLEDREWLHEEKEHQVEKSSDETIMSRIWSFVMFCMVSIWRFFSYWPKKRVVGIQKGMTGFWSFFFCEFRRPCICLRLRRLSFSHLFTSFSLPHHSPGLPARVHPILFLVSVADHVHLRRPAVLQV